MFYPQMISVDHPANAADKFFFKINLAAVTSTRTKWTNVGVDTSKVFKKIFREKKKRNFGQLISNNYRIQYLVVIIQGRIM
jgi:hypothetical protein